MGGEVDFDPIVALTVRNPVECFVKVAQDGDVEEVAI